VLENAQRGTVGLDSDARLEAALSDRDQLAGLYLAHQLGADDVERAALGGDHEAVAELPQAKGAHAGRVAECDHAVIRHHDRRIRALEALHDLCDRVLDPLGGVRRDQRGDDLRVRGGAKHHALRGQLVVQLDGVD
jgi:hypothetical protein